MVDHIVQFGHALALPAAATHGGHAALIPVIILLLILVLVARARPRRRGRASATPPPRSNMRRPRSARQAMSATPGQWESDTEPQDGSSIDGS